MSVRTARRGDRIAAAGAPATAAYDVYRVLDAWVEIHTTSPDARLAVRNLLRGFGSVADRPDRPEGAARYTLTVDAGLNWQVRAGAAVLCTNCRFSVALATLEWQIVTDAVARRADLFHLHGAALVAPASGVGLVLAGDSGSGKTTLALGLMLRNFLPFNDDVALLDPATLALQPFPRAFHIEAGTRRLLDDVAVPSAWDFDAGPAGYFVPPRWAAGPAPLRYIVLPTLRPDEAPRLMRLAPAEAAAALLGQTASLERAPRRALAAVARLTEQARCYRLCSGDLAETAALVEALVSGGAEASGDGW